MGNKHTCGACVYWSHATRRQCSHPDTPVYYAECFYPIDLVVFPHCVTFEETNAENGTGCPCWEVADNGNDPVNRTQALNPPLE